MRTCGRYCLGRGEGYPHLPHWFKIAPQVLLDSGHLCPADHAIHKQLCVLCVWMNNLRNGISGGGISIAGIVYHEIYAGTPSRKVVFKKNLFQTLSPCEVRPFWNNR